MRMMLTVVGILFGCLFLWKAFQGWMMRRYFASMVPVVTVSTMNVNYSAWQPKLTASGSLSAVLGVDITTSLAGMVQTIYFTPGSTVKAGTVLVQLNADTEIGQLKSLQANAELAKITYHRDKAQYAVHAVSKQTIDNDYLNWKSLEGQVEEQAATVAKKTLRAPFTGRLGISLVNPGQYVNTGTKVVSLQTFDPIFVDFYLPQQALSQIKIGQRVTVTVDAYPHQTFSGKITTIDPAVNSGNRNVEVEATIANPKEILLPGMFVYVSVEVGVPTRYLTIPQAAVSFNPYGDVVYVVRREGEDKKGQPILVAKQAFVTTGDTRGDQVAILKGLKKNDMIVTSGQIKLKNGDRIAINNKVVPANNPAPTFENDEEE